MKIAIIIYFSGAKIILFAQTKKKKQKIVKCTQKMID